MRKYSKGFLNIMLELLKLLSFFLFGQPEELLCGCLVKFLMLDPGEYKIFLCLNPLICNLDCRLGVWDCPGEFHPVTIDPKKLGFMIMVRFI
jgi:hypothetical protein